MHLERVIYPPSPVSAGSGAHGRQRRTEPMHYLPCQHPLRRCPPTPSCTPDVARTLCVEHGGAKLSCGHVVQVYRYLEPLYNDFRKVRQLSPDGSYALAHVDELVEAMIFTDHIFDTALPRLPRRADLETQVPILPPSFPARKRTVCCGSWPWSDVPLLSLTVGPAGKPVGDRLCAFASVALCFMLVGRVGEVGASWNALRGSVAGGAASIAATGMTTVSWLGRAYSYEAWIQLGFTKM